MSASRAASRRVGAPLINPTARLSLGIVVGLTAEARIARRLGGRVSIGGGTPGGARRAALGLAGSGATALLSFGLAGGLDPALRPGDLLVPRCVLAGGRGLDTDPALCIRLGGGTQHVLLGGERIVTDAFEKLALWRATGCAAVDLESGPTAEVAAARGLPFAVLRAICDAAGRALPPVGAVALDASGAIALGRVLWSLAREPRQLGALLALAGDAGRARRALSRRVAAIVALR